MLDTIQYIGHGSSSNSCTRHFKWQVFIFMTNTFNFWQQRNIFGGWDYAMAFSFSANKNYVATG